jgi:Zn-finger protein
MEICFLPVGICHNYQFLHFLKWTQDMDIKKIWGTDQICVLSSTDLKEFALELIEEIKAQEKVDNKMYTADEFAEKHSVSKQTLWRWCEEGILKSMKIGGKVYYKESDLKSL